MNNFFTIAKEIGIKTNVIFCDKHTSIYCQISSQCYLIIFIFIKNRKYI